MIIFLTILITAAVLLCALRFLTDGGPYRRSYVNRMDYGGGDRIGVIHQIGTRSSQQDSFGIQFQGKGLLIAVADGVGGLANGAEVSNAAITLLLREPALPGRLRGRLLRTNQKINTVLGKERLRQCGTTLVAAEVWRNHFSWVSVGDSRVCIFRNGCLIQMNHEHNCRMNRKGQRSGCPPVPQTEIDADGGKLTSFIGMGKLRYVDSSVRPERVQRGDILLLLSDGVFKTASNEAIEDILRIALNAKDAAKTLENYILSQEIRRQDNFTAVVVDLWGGENQRGDSVENGL